MQRKIVHIIGTGTIGEPLIGLLCDYQKQLGIDEVTFSKNAASKDDRSKVLDLVKKGARLCVSDGLEKNFKKLGMDPDLETLEAIKINEIIMFLILKIKPLFVDLVSPHILHNHTQQNLSLNSCENLSC